jgi:hypothetical protein
MTDQEIQALVYATVSDCVKMLRRKEYELDLPPDALTRARKSLSFYRRQNGRCRGGADKIAICLNGWQRGNRVFQEYDSYSSDPTIGNRPINDEGEYFMLITAHEVAHHIQFAYGWKVARFRLTWRKPHGDCFKAIYRYLRRDLINPTLNGNSQLMAAGK